MLKYELSDLYDMTMEQLRELNSEVVTVIRGMQARSQQEAALAFKPGDFVLIERKKWPFGVLKIRVTKINQKTLSGFEVAADGTDSPKRWKVSPTLCTKAT